MEIWKDDDFLCCTPSPFQQRERERDAQIRHRGCILLLGGLADLDFNLFFFFFFFFFFSLSQKTSRR